MHGRARPHPSVNLSRLQVGEMIPRQRLEYSAGRVAEFLHSIGPTRTTTGPDALIHLPCPRHTDRVSRGRLYVYGLSALYIDPRLRVRVRVGRDVPRYQSNIDSLPTYLES